MATIIFIEYKKYNSCLSPASLVTISYGVAIVFAKLGNIFFSYLEISDKVYTLILLSIIVTWIPSFIIPVKLRVKEKYYALKDPSYANYLILFLISVLLTIGLLLCLKRGSLGSESFEMNYSRGIFAHLRNLFSVLIAYLICFSKKTKKIIFYIFLGIFFIFLSGTKYHLYFLFFPLLLLNLRNPSLKDIFILIEIGIVGCFAIFALNYFIGFLFRGITTDGFIGFIINHLLKYIGGGLIGFSQWLEGVPPIYEGYRWVDTVHVENTNVCTLIGGLYMGYGYASYILIFVISVISYVFFYLIVSNDNNRVLFLTYCYISGIPLLLSFFSWYYSLTNIWEMVICSLVVEIVLSRKLLWKLI